jgi:hypothetical protein
MTNGNHNEDYYCIIMRLKKGGKIMKKWWMIIFIGCFLVMPVMAHAQLDKLLEGLLGRGEEGIRLEQLKITQLEMIPDPVREGQRVSFRATISNSSRNHVRLVLAVMDRDRVVSQINDAYLRSGDTQINFPEMNYQFFGREERCLTIETNIDRRWVPIAMAAEFCPKRSSAGWSAIDRGVGQVQVEELLMSPDPVSPGQEVRFMVRLRNDGRPIRGNIRIQDRDQVIVQTDAVNIPRGTTDFQLPRSQYTFQRMDTCFTVSVDIDRTPYPVDASKEYCANPTAWTLKSRVRDHRDDRDLRGDRERGR